MAKWICLKAATLVAVNLPEAMMRAISKAPLLVTFRGGFVADFVVVSRLLDLEARGARFELLADGRIRVSPSELLDPETRDYLRARRAETRRVLEYQADLSQLT